MKFSISLSRKGFDSSAGGSSSPIINSQYLSFPIPEAGSDFAYKEIRPMGQQKDLLAIMRDLKIKQYSEGHMDPNLCPELYGLDRSAGWMPAFGQDDKAQQHLKKQGFGSGSIFLFFGRFRHAHSNEGVVKWSSNESFHAIYGFMEVGVVHSTHDEHEYLKANGYGFHPHVRKKDYYEPNSTLYLPAAKSIHGLKHTSGIFRFDPALILSKNQNQLIHWNLPKPMKHLNYSHLKRNPITKGHVIKGHGQEIVANGDAKSLEWIKMIIENYSI